MCSSGIAWCSFTWEAFATLVTGVLAVGAAYWVGRRQTEIQNRQANIQEAGLRSDLFDRRYRVFERTEQFIREIIQSDEPSPGTQRDFVLAIGESRFLFNESVKSGLDEIWKNSVEFHALNKVMEQSYLTQGHYGDGNPEKRCVASVWFGERFFTLPDMFEELRLGTHLLN